MSDSDTRQREIATAAALLFLRHERRTHRALLQTEKRTLASLRHASDGALHRAASLSSHGDMREQLAQIRRTVPLMARSLEQALLVARGDARASARGTLIGRFGHVRVSPLDGRDEHDSAAAHSAAGSLASGWGTRATATVMDEADPLHPFRTSARDARLERTAATETASAFNDERRRIVRNFAEDERASYLVKVWSALLDRGTCRECFGKDGEVKKLDESFGVTPPVHPHCRCVIEIVHVPRPERLDDIAVDYARLKDEIEDRIREHRIRAARPAREFIEESIGAARSPVALTRRFERMNTSR
jgi:hypothetical protein